METHRNSWKLQWKPVEHQLRECGCQPSSVSFMEQDGRSATITAPSGPAQQRALQNSLRDSELLLGERASLGSRGEENERMGIPNGQSGLWFICST